MGDAGSLVRGLTWRAPAPWEGYVFPRAPGVFAVGRWHQGHHEAGRPGWDPGRVNATAAAAELRAGNGTDDGGFQEPLQIQAGLTCQGTGTTGREEHVIHG